MRIAPLNLVFRRLLRRVADFPRPYRYAVISSSWLRFSGDDAITKESRSFFDEQELGSARGSVAFLAMQRPGDFRQLDSPGTFRCGERFLEYAVRALGARFVHVLDDSLYTLERVKSLLGEVPILLTAVSEDPTADLPSAPVLEEAIHQAASGGLKIVVKSKGALQRCAAVGFPYATVVEPWVPIDELHGTGAKAHSRFTVGFASNPVEEGASRDRGLVLLANLAEALPEVRFLIPWRKSEFDPEIYLDPARLPNVDLLQGKVRMADFYQEIDCLLVPFTSSRHCHASPFSLVEALRLGIPAVVTDRVGIATKLQDVGHCLVREPRLDALKEGIETARADPPRPRQGDLEFLESCFGQEKSTASYEALYAELEATPLVLTLSRWRKALEKRGAVLIKGPRNLASYYSDFDVSSIYMEARFKSGDLQQFNEEECRVVREIVQTHVDSGAEGEMLDLAGGTGRVGASVMDVIPVTVCDSSKEMLAELSNAYGDGIKTLVSSIEELEADGSWGLVSCFRYLRHLSASERNDVFGRIRSLLRPNGLFLYDCPNREFEIEHRNEKGWGRYNVYDVFYSEAMIVAEMNANGFVLQSIVPVGRDIPMGRSELPSDPMTWVAVGRLAPEHVSKPS